MSPRERDQLRQAHRERVRDLLIVGAIALTVLVVLYLTFG